MEHGNSKPGAEGERAVIDAYWQPSGSDPAFGRNQIRISKSEIRNKFKTENPNVQDDPLPRVLYFRHASQALPAMIAVHSLTKRFYGGGHEIFAVDRVSFVIPPGEVYGLLGPNGAGKTTTIRMVVGLLQPDDGYAEVGGFRTSDMPDEVKSRIGLVSSSTGLYPSLSVREMLLFFADLYRMDLAEASESLAKLSRLLQLTELSGSALRHAEHRPAAACDVGSRLDPRSARHPAGRTDARPGRDRHAGRFRLHPSPPHEGKAVMVSTHRLDEAQRLCDRFGLLHQGRLRLEGPLDQLQAATGCQTLVEMFMQWHRGWLVEARATATVDADVCTRSGVVFVQAT